MATILLLIGLVLAIATLKDVFDTVMVPGGSRAMLRVARRIVSATLPIWRLAGRGQKIPTSFAPFVLLASFVIWMLLLTLAFGCILYALGHEMHPQLSDFAQALYVAGSALVTVGLSGASAEGAARWAILVAAFCGLAIMTMAVTYLLEIQTSIADRDAGILKLTTAGGEPPCAISLFERYADLDMKEHIPEILRGGREWCAQVLQSHASHPTLVYFRSVGTGSGWPASLGTLMDFALIVEFLLDAPEWRGLAILLREDGSRMAHTLIEMLGLRRVAAPPAEMEIERLLARLKQAGYAVKEKPDWSAFCALRARHASCVRSMARHLGTPEAPLLSDGSSD